MDLDFLLGALMVAVAVHAALLLFVLVRALLPARREEAYQTCMAAGTSALLGELLLLGGLVGRPLWVLVAPLFLVAGLGIALYARRFWTTTPAGHAARQAVYAAPLGLLLTALVWIQ